MILVALLGWGIYSTGLKLGETKAKNTHYSSSYARHAANQIRRTCLTGEGGDIAECVTEVITTTNEHERAQDDLEAQTKMALWAFWMLVATVVMAAITALGVIFVWQTLKATQKMAEDTRDIGEAQVRAYVTCRDGDFRITPHGVQCNIPIENVGQSPALRVRANCIIEYVDQPNQGNKRLDILCGISEAISPNGTEIAGSYCNVKGDPGVIYTSRTPEKPLPEISENAAEVLLSRSALFLTAQVTIGWTDVFDVRRNITFEMVADRAAPIQNDANGNRFRKGVLHRKKSMWYREV